MGHPARQSEAQQPMLFARWIVRSAVVATAAFALTGCPGLSQRGELPPSVDRADTLAREGDQAGAARVYEALAAQNSGADRNEFLFRAARAYLSAHLPEDAARVIADVEPPLSPQQASERALFDVQLALERGQGQQAWQRIGALAEP